MLPPYKTCTVHRYGHFNAISLLLNQLRGFIFFINKSATPDPVHTIVFGRLLKMFFQGNNVSSASGAFGVDGL